MNIKRLERLWTACPELRTECLTIIGSSVWLSIDGFDFLDDEISHDLIFARLLKWIVSKTQSVKIDITSSGNTRIEWIPPDDGDADFQHVWHTDPLEACVLAVERVLGLPTWNEDDISKH